MFHNRSLNYIILYNQGTHFGKTHFIPYYKSPTCFGRIRRHHQGVSNSTNKIQNKTQHILLLVSLLFLIQPDDCREYD
jgi:hypothetical protein